MRGKTESPISRKSVALSAKRGTKDDQQTGFDRQNAKLWLVTL